MDLCIVPNQKIKTESLLDNKRHVSIVVFPLLFWPMYFINLLQSIWSPTLRDKHSASEMTPTQQKIRVEKIFPLWESIIHSQK